MIRLQGLSMVYFTGCDFKYPLVSELTTPDGGYSFLAGWRGSAIYAFNTQLTIQARNLSPYCLSCEDYDRSTFSGFDVAVNAYYSGTAGGLKIDRTDFVNI
jgi:hypothetical protein